MLVSVCLVFSLKNKAERPAITIVDVNVVSIDGISVNLGGCCPGSNDLCGIGI